MADVQEADLPKRYDPKEAEPKWRKRWDDERLYAHELTPESFSIDTPPPTVSGRMHIGHACSFSQQDFYARYRRMKTGKVFFPFGTDDNGLPTERLVEKLKGVKGAKMDRGEFRELCLKTVQELLAAFIQDWKDIGMSCDFGATYSTIDRHSQATSQRSFIDLFHKGRVYREESPVAWCPLCQTAIAQAEFDNIDLQSTFNDIRFGDDLIVATTRPELIPACVALAVHPTDERYAKLNGKFVKIPLSDREVPVITDEKVDIGKGTGLMMVCTFGDKEDVEKWRKHNLPLRVIFTRDGKLNDLAGTYAGLTIKEARKQIIDDLKSQGRLANQKQITHAVNVHERCGTEVEFLKTPQWYIRVLDLKEELLAAGAKIHWHPAFMKTRYDHWVENLNWDWCISRQRFYGVPFPVWYDRRDGRIYVADESQLPVDPLVDKPKGVPESEWEHLEPDIDVMDTWATSSSTPQIITGWHEDPEKTKRLLPLSLRPQAHDIIRTWAFYTIVKAHLNNGTIPWRNIAVSGYITDPHGQKMSKSKGNVVEPQAVIRKYSADAIRFWAAGSKLGEDTPYQEKELVTGHKTITKLWNASRFVLMNLQDYDGWNGRFEDLEIMDRWILSQCNSLVRRCTEYLEAYEHSKAKFEVDQFFWHFTDNYIEIVKGRLYDPKDILHKRSAQFALVHVLEGILKLFAPFMPYVTEEIYQLLPIRKEKSIHISRWPTYREDWHDSDAEMVGHDVVRVVEEVRKHKSERQLSMAAPVAKLAVTTKHDLTLAENDLLAVTRAQEFSHRHGEFDVRIE